jgi:hypothetical protein
MHRSRSGALAAAPLALFALAAAAACELPLPAEEACRLLPAAEVEAAVGQPVAPRSSAEGTCGWYPAADTAAPSLLLVQLLRSGRLRAEGRYPDARTFFEVTAGLAGSAFGTEPEPVAGVGEAAVWGGGQGGELWALQGDAVVGLLSAELGRPAMERLARRALGALEPAEP